MGKARTLRKAVNVGGEWYYPGDDDIPANVAEQITNPKAWADYDGPGADEAGNQAAGPARRNADAGTSDGRRLARHVTVAGVTYGPNDPIPDDIAEKITNPKAWEGGKASAKRPTRPVEREGKAADGGNDSGQDGEGDGGDDPGNPPASPPAAPLAPPVAKKAAPRGGKES